ncbi:SMC-Scp complex subunit ScpB [Timonella senegalensis]|jgi:segregation and condensation protein B|uniref:SMC-Scp complex subunit ScpB n=1 Tax=Timonella senegalensis TaxID=1465825 RepID=UPI0028B1579B|nr:SMC-Scp complex subunit ScpB [Timonella senegalensis]
MTGAHNRRESVEAELRQELEAILMVTDEPVEATLLGEVLGVEPARIEQELRDLAAEYEGKGEGPRRGFRLRESGAGWRVYSAPEHFDVVSQFVTAGRTSRLSQAALETLAVIAYRQPVSRSEIAAIRGVNVDGVVRTLLARDLITEVAVVGESGPTRFETTRYFMEKMGIGSLSELPSLAPALPPIDDADEIDEIARSATMRAVPTNTHD